MAEFENVQLSEALKNLKKNRNQQTISFAITALLSGRFLAPATWDIAPKLNAQGDPIFDPKTKFQLAVVQNAKKEMFFPVFTSMEQVRKWDPKRERQCLILSIAQMANFLNSANGEIAGIIFDPIDLTMPFRTGFILELQKHNGALMKANRIEKGMEIKVRNPQENVEDLTITMAEFAKDNPEITQIYLKERVYSDRPSHWFVIVKMHPERPECFQRMGQACKEVNHGKEIEFMFASSDLAKQMIENNKPFYNTEK